MPKKSRTDEFNEQIQKSRITNNWSNTVFNYQKITSKIDWEDFEIVTTKKKQPMTASNVVFGHGIRESHVG
ncbi:hypothetical protein DM02DRAFT_649886 [Periconia macrospinosa]|uniref:Uncharacterized protein n=1 Tax=Periconia macrospinosa TaxID=97972 RepID=A0A2V1EAV9_9PLEO|nr:hypothetical protein DM02DRAFT_649886 [Periconia macrospinosa]